MLWVKLIQIIIILSVFWFIINLCAPKFVVLVKVNVHNKVPVLWLVPLRFQHVHLLFTVPTTALSTDGITARFWPTLTTCILSLLIYARLRVFAYWLDSFLTSMTAHDNGTNLIIATILSIWGDTLQFAIFEGTSWTCCSCIEADGKGNWQSY